MSLTTSLIYGWPLSHSSSLKWLPWLKRLLNETLNYKNAVFCVTVKTFNAKTPRGFGPKKNTVQTDWKCWKRRDRHKEKQNWTIKFINLSKWNVWAISFVLSFSFRLKSTSLHSFRKQQKGREFPHTYIDKIFIRFNEALQIWNLLFDVRNKIFEQITFYLELFIWSTSSWIPALSWSFRYPPLVRWFGGFGGAASFSWNINNYKLSNEAQWPTFI